jgi:hypothetical protein
MVLVTRAKIQQKGRNGKRYGLFKPYLNPAPSKELRVASVIISTACSGRWNACQIWDYTF